MSEQALMRVEEGAKTLGVSTATLRRWIAGGVLAKVKLGRSVRVRAQDIAEVVERGVEYPRRGSDRA
jgi:excisionase family DNA binding protein